MKTIIECCKDQELVYTIMRDLYICMGCGVCYDKEGDIIHD